MAWKTERELGAICHTVSLEVLAVKRRVTLLVLVTFALALAACSPGGGPATAPAAAVTPTADLARPQGWDEQAHGSDAEPSFDIVFPQDKVNQIKITIDPADWEAMQANMTELFGARRTGGQGAIGPRDPRRPEGGALPGQQLPEGEVPPVGPQQPGDGALPGPQFPGDGAPQAPRGQWPGGGGLQAAAENPMWVPATIEFAGKTWSHVGVRYKGNSSLRSAWSSGTLKMPLKLDFDEFEDDYPEIKNQRFYGFKQLSLANGFGDPTYMREMVAYDLLEEAGLAAAETAYYEVLLDYGEGPTSLGLYTVIEVIDDTVIERCFGDDSGSIYEAEGPAASLAQGTLQQIPSSFQKENNEDSDWSDIEALYNVLHSEERTTDAAAWRAKLESVFDVDGFLEWLAISSMIQHWDTYGQMPHNYYLYNDPATGRLVWISWDHNLVLGAQMGGGTSRGRSASLDKKDVSANWPLIRYLLDDPTYYDAYANHLKEARSSVFDPDRLAAKYEQLADLIAPYAAKDGGEEEFGAAVQELTRRTQELAEAAAAFARQ